MDIKVQYAIHNRLSDYQIPKFYADTTGNKPKLRNRDKKAKRPSVFDQIINMHAKVPGPGRYSINSQIDNKKKQKTIQVDKQKYKERQTYLNPILKRSMSLPSVGKYNIQKKQKIHKNKDKDQNNAQLITKPSVFDICNRDTLNVSPGSYQISKSLQKSPRYSIPPQPKKQKSLPKIPSPQDYNPVPTAFTTFQSIHLSNADQFKKTNFGARIIQKLKQKSPGPKYNLITNWVPKKKSLISNQFNIYKTITFPSKQSIYH